MFRQPQNSFGPQSRRNGVQQQQQQQQRGGMIPEESRLMMTSQQKEFFQGRKYALLKKKEKCCVNPFWNGLACGSCTACLSALRTTCMEDGITDAWCRSMGRHCARLRFLDAIFIYDYNGVPILPGQPGVDFTSGVSQALIYHPAVASAFASFPTITILTLQTEADFPTQASLSPGEFVLYFPRGSLVDETFSIGNYWGLSNVTLNDIAVISSSYTTEVPYMLLNVAWRLAGIDTNGQSVLTAMSVAMYRRGWVIETDRIMTSVTLSAESAGKGVVEVTSHNESIGCGFWTLTRLSISQIIFLVPIYICAILPPCGDVCDSCRSGYDEGCGGTRCGKNTLLWSFGCGNAISEPENYSEKIVSQPTDLEILEDVLHNKSKKYSGLTINPDNMEIVLGTVSDNLIYCGRQMLKDAHAVARRRFDNVKLIDSATLGDQEVGHAALDTSRRQKAAFKEHLARVTRIRDENIDSSSTRKVQPQSPSKSSASSGSSTPTSSSSLNSSMFLLDIAPTTGATPKQTRSTSRGNAKTVWDGKLWE